MRCDTGDLDLTILKKKGQHVIGDPPTQCENFHGEEISPRENGTSGISGDTIPITPSRYQIAGNGMGILSPEIPVSHGVVENIQMLKLRKGSEAHFP